MGRPKRRTIVACHRCKKTFERTLSRMKERAGAKHIFCGNKCSHKFLSGKNHPRWKNGWYRPDGYIEYSYHRKAHHIVMEKILGRSLKPHESVHHKNGNRSDNNPDNLELWTIGQPSGQRVADLIKFVVTNYWQEALLEKNIIHAPSL